MLSAMGVHHCCLLQSTRKSSTVELAINKQHTRLIFHDRWWLHSCKFKDCFVKIPTKSQVFYMMRKYTGPCLHLSTCCHTPETVWRLNVCVTKWYISNYKVIWIIVEIKIMMSAALTEEIITKDNTNPTISVGMQGRHLEFSISYRQYFRSPQSSSTMHSWVETLQ